MAESSDGNIGDNITNSKCGSNMHCIKGLLLPMWDPEPYTATLEDRITFAIGFTLAIIYIFIGMSLVTEIFAIATEKIIAQKMVVKKVLPNGETKITKVPVWNPIVAQYTLGIIGTCAPEILLTLVEVIKFNFTAGELGPGTIVGAGAYNLFIIQGICIGSITRGKSKKIQELPQYFITAAWAIFAYVWLFIILIPSSKGVVEVWEALLTLLFFPILVLTAYLMDKKFFGLCTTTKRVSSSSDGSPDGMMEKLENRYNELVAEVKESTPNRISGVVTQVAAVRLLREIPKGRGYYRMQATKGISGGADLINAKRLQELVSHNENARQQLSNAADKNKQFFYFDPSSYSVMEDVGVFYVNVVRRGLDLNQDVSIDFTTRDGSGKAGIDYQPTKGTILFQNGEKVKRIPITMIDDDEFTNDSDFYIDICNPQLANSQPNGDLKLVVENSSATIHKMDDDQGGVFHFEHEQLDTHENCGEMDVLVKRSSGVKGRVQIKFEIEPISAQPELHYLQPVEMTLLFEPRQTEQNIKVKILNEGKVKKEKTFKVTLKEPQWREELTTSHEASTSKIRKNRSRQSSAAKYEIQDVEHDEATGSINISKLGRPRLGSPTSTTVTIRESEHVKATLEEIMNISDNFGELVSSSSWREQFSEAVALNGDVDPETGARKMPSFKHFVTHFLTIFWKVLFATIPPTHIGFGWPTVFCSLLYIGLMSTLLGDLASQLGCTIGLHDDITAITFVALGTSLPDMFGSRMAAIKEETADAAIGTVNGGVAVNVFVGLGLSWSVAAIYQSYHDSVLQVPPGTLAFSFTLFIVFAFVCNTVVLLRRMAPIFGELGGPEIPKVFTLVFFVMLWIMYVVLAALDSYCVISTF